MLSLRSFCSNVALSVEDSVFFDSFSEVVAAWTFVLASGLAPAKAPKPNEEPFAIGFEQPEEVVAVAGEAEPFSAW